MATNSATSESPASSHGIVGTLKTLMVEHSLPLWSREGWDRSTGGFVERLDAQGRADREAARRVRVQARQIYCFAKAAQIGWYPEGREIALKGLEYLLATAKSPDGQPGFVHLLAPDGSVVNRAARQLRPRLRITRTCQRLCSRSGCTGSRRDRLAAGISRTRNCDRLMAASSKDCPHRCRGDKIRTCTCSRR